VVTREMVAGMEPGSVIVDISVDQGGCVETTRPTTYADPTYVEEGVVHFCVTNMPGAVPHSSSHAISAALLPYVLQLAETGWEDNAALRRGINVRAGEVVHPALRVTP
jgi:alanine dehydrogenase